MTDGSVRVVRVAAPVREQVVLNLRREIREGRLTPGQDLPERELCELLGVSRTTFREALRQLEGEGLVQVVPGRGSTIATVTAKEARNLYEIREALEQLAGKLFTLRITPERLADLDSTVICLREAYELNDFDEMLSAKDRFYDVLFAGSENEMLQGIMQTLHVRITALRSASLSSPGRSSESLAEIEAILAAVRSGSPDDAGRACQNHVLRAWEVIAEVLKESRTE
jgi:DNA-binding GntR family transcriptional regulator